MGVCGYLFLPWKCLVVVSLRLLFLVPTGVPVRSGDATFPKAMDNVTVRQGESATLRCTIDNRVTRVAWLNRSTILYAGNDKWCLDPRVVLLSNTQTQYSIEIQNVDVYDEGPYTCSVQTDNHPKTSRVHLIVQVSPKIVEISSDISINEGNNISLTCIATGRPEPTVTWRHISPKAVGFVSEDEYLEIQGITREQSGDYECSASNDVAAPVVRRVKVTVNYPPYISEAKGTGVPVGQKGTLQCEASAVPSAEFQWYKDDKRLAEGKKGVKVENRPFLSKLIFFNVSEHDYGNYTCVASNRLGHTNASITLFANWRGAWMRVGLLDCSKSSKRPRREDWLLLQTLRGRSRPWRRQRGEQRDTEEGRLPLAATSPGLPPAPVLMRVPPPTRGSCRHCNHRPSSKGTSDSKSKHPFPTKMQSNTIPSHRRLGHKFEGGEPRTLWANAFQKDTENPSPCRPGRYVGTAEFSLFSRGEECAPSFGYPPARQLHCPRGGRGLRGSAHPRAPAKENSGVGHPQIQSVTRSKCKVRHAPQCVPAADCATVLCAMKCQFITKQINKKETKQNSLPAATSCKQQPHRPRSPLRSSHSMGIVDHKGFPFTLNSLNSLF